MRQDGGWQSRCTALRDRKSGGEIGLPPSTRPEDDSGQDAYRLGEKAFHHQQPDHVNLLESEDLLHGNPLVCEESDKDGAWQVGVCPRVRKGVRVDIPSLHTK